MAVVRGALQEVDLDQLIQSIDSEVLSLMYHVYGDMLSGNCYKIKLLLRFLGIPHTWTHVDILAQETRTETFKAMNPNARIPVIDLGEHCYLWESNAILNYLAQETDFLPIDRYHHAQVLQWQFFEQYSHEPYIATARYLNKYLGLPADRQGEYESKQAGGHQALAIMDQHLSQNSYFVGNTPTIADISLYAYTHVAPEGGFELGAYGHVQRWIDDFESLPGYLAMSRENSSL